MSDPKVDAGSNQGKDTTVKVPEKLPNEDRNGKLLHGSLIYKNTNTINIQIKDIQIQILASP